MKIKKPKKKEVFESLIYSLFCIGSIIYMEFIFHMFIFQNPGEYIYFPILFALPAGILISLLASLFKRTVNIIILWISLFFLTVFYFAEMIYTHIFKIPLLFTNIGKQNLQAVAYYREFLAACKACLPGIILLLLPLVTYGILLLCKIKPNKKGVPVLIGYAVAFLIFTITSVLCINQQRSAKNSIYDNYKQMYDTAAAVEDFGVLTTLRLSAKGLIFKSSTEVDVDDFEIGPPVDVIIETTKENELSSEQDSENETNTEEETTAPPEPVIDTSPNAMNIDFMALAANESNKNLNALHQYFASIVPSNKNEYTGMFERYNLIYLTAEAFSPYCVDKDLTPTLYKLVNEGFVFKNYYVPNTGESTCGGEFMNCTGLLPNPNRPAGTYSFIQTKDNYMPFSMGNQFKRHGITSYAYHNNSLSYYSRNLTIPNLGYIFKAASSGALDDAQARADGLIYEMEHPHQWPQSDFEMIQATAPEYITSNQQFHGYYMTVSGHMNYSYDGNAMSYKNREAVAHLPYSDPCKAYIACNIELDKALEHLIGQLEAAGVLDKTVICMSADHYPYGLTNAEISEFVGHTVEENFELYRNNLVLWNSAMEEPIVIEKSCSSIDILPTLSNLFGFTYDSRLFPGTDILSDSPGYVMFFHNRSVITDTYMYNSSNKQITDLNGTPIEISDEEYANISKKFNLKMAMNQLMIEENYYNVIKDELEKNFTPIN